MDHINAIAERALGNCLATYVRGLKCYGHSRHRGPALLDQYERMDDASDPRAVHHFSESKNGVKLALNHKFRSQPRFQENETRSRGLCLEDGARQSL